MEAEGKKEKAIGMKVIMVFDSCPGRVIPQRIKIESFGWRLEAGVSQNWSQNPIWSILASKLWVEPSHPSFFNIKSINSFFLPLNVSFISVLETVMEKIAFCTAQRQIQSFKEDRHSINGCWLNEWLHGWMNEYCKGATASGAVCILLCFFS